MAGTQQIVEANVSLIAQTVTSVASSEVNSLEGINVAGLQDRATCYVRVINTLPMPQPGIYRYFDTSTAVADGITVVAPTNGPGRWILEQLGAGVPLECCGNFEFFDSTPPVPFVSLPAPVAGVTQLVLNTAATWVATPANGAFTALSPGVIRYDGAAPCKVKVEMTFLLAQSTVPLGVFLEIGFNVNFIPPLPGAQGRTSNPFGDGLAAQITTHGLVDINPGDLLHAVIGQSTFNGGPVTCDVYGCIATITCCCG